MAIRESSYGYWSSHRRFLWVAGGAAIGIGNVARLPYLAGEYGGAVFLVAYVLALVVVAWPVLMAEWTIGRWMREDLINGLVRLATTGRTHRAWIAIGGLSLLSAVLILSYYSVIAGWSLAYTFRAAGGALTGLNAEGSRAVFFAVAQDPERSLAWHTIFMVTACVVVAHGVRDGMERAAAYLVPTSFVLILGVLAYAFNVGDGRAALVHLLKPDWSHFGWRGAFEAIQQAYFTMALGLGAMVAYGSYLPAPAPLARLAAGVLLLDTAFSLIAGCALYALIFAAGLDPAPGITLLFQELPLALTSPAGGLALTAVYLVLFLITLSAALALMEPAVRFLVERLRITRVFAAIASAMLTWYLGLATLLSFNVWESLRWWNRTVFDWLQWLTGQWLVPLTGLLLCIYISRILPPELKRELWGERAPRLEELWTWLLRYPARVALIALLLYGTGAVDALISFWSAPAGSPGGA